MSELLSAAVDRIKAMRTDAELLVHALAGAVVFAAAEHARATAAINDEDETMFEAQRKAEDQKAALQLAWSEARQFANNIADRLEVFHLLEDRAVRSGL
ncbi:hypothetical protein RsS62_28190 [Rhizobium dioscoreae]|uniref:hypothetical protein n=1 Tax=Rhizobium dioscoreae TaxID=2653122 RepID=UPI0012611631|nr:hypothetical protein [Rhizobium dioscoreae]GES43567.1 hypothetical protein RsS62_28190 [Rhizobium dioscoreae]